jgi:hypothetical protein
MFRTVSDALAIALRIASSTLTGLLPTISLNLYTWSLTVPPDMCRTISRPWHASRAGAPRTSFRSFRIRRPAAADAEPPARAPRRRTRYSAS